MDQINERAEWERNEREYELNSDQTLAQLMDRERDEARELANEVTTCYVITFMK